MQSGGPRRGRPPPPRSNAPIVGGLVAFVGLMGIVPWLLHKRHMRLQNGVPLWASDKPLSPNQVRRGPYLNTSSVDIGPDPDWDHKTGLYKGRRPGIVDASATSGSVRTPDP